MIRQRIKAKVGTGKIVPHSPDKIGATYIIANAAEREGFTKAEFVTPCGQKVHGKGLAN